jgi:hypothetical protein
MLALAPALSVLGGCSSGKQTLGWETSPGTSVPWAGGPSYWARFTYGPSADPTFFPILVWLQSPPNADRFGNVGINFFAGLWEGPTEAQLTDLGSAGMPVLCDQSGPWRAHVNDAVIRGWMQPDQPDDAQLQSDGSYAGCIQPAAITASYASLVLNDATRPVFMNLGRGTVDGTWEGRGSCSGRDDMYPEYVLGADVLTFVTYPLKDGLPLETVAAGVDAVRRYSNDEKPVFAAIQASDVAGEVRPTPEQIKASVWMALVHGAMGLQYFCHRLEPTVDETDCIDDAPTAAALTAINQQITDLAPILNTPSVASALTVASSAAGVPVDTMLKQSGAARYVFAVGMRGAHTTARFTLSDLAGNAGTVEVIGEARTVALTDGSFTDDFSAYAVHLYRIAHP